MTTQQAKIKKRRGFPSTATYIAYKHDFPVAVGTLQEVADCLGVTIGTAYSNVAMTANPEKYPVKFDKIIKIFNIDKLLESYQEDDNVD